LGLTVVAVESVRTIWSLTKLRVPKRSSQRLSYGTGTRFAKLRISSWVRGRGEIRKTLGRRVRCAKAVRGSCPDVEPIPCQVKRRQRRLTWLGAVGVGKVLIVVLSELVRVSSSGLRQQKILTIVGQAERMRDGGSSWEDERWLFERGVPSCYILGGISTMLIVNMVSDYTAHSHHVERTS
jgi:hypothetical protein